MEGIKLIDIVFLMVTGAIAYHGITYKDQEGNRTTVHLLFGCIALIFFLRVLFFDILKITGF